MYIIHHTLEVVQEKHLTMQYSPLTHNQVSFQIQKQMFFYEFFFKIVIVIFNNSTNISKTNELSPLPLKQLNTKMTKT